MRSFSEELTPREWAQHNNEKEMLELQMAHAKEMKRLEIELQTLEAKWATWIRIPLVIITLPVRFLAIIPLSIYAATKQEVPEFYKKLLT